MPMYDFVDVESGEAEELFFPVDERPAVGETVRNGGRTLRRVMSAAVQVAVQRDIHFTAWSLEPNTPGFARYNAQGQPLVSSKQEIREALRINRDLGTDLAYGDGLSAVE